MQEKRSGTYHVIIIYYLIIFWRPNFEIVTVTGRSRHNINIVLLLLLYIANIIIYPSPSRVVLFHAAYYYPRCTGREKCLLNITKKKNKLKLRGLFEKYSAREHLIFSAKRKSIFFNIKSIQPKTPSGSTENFEELKKATAPAVPQRSEFQTLFK